MPSIDRTVYPQLPNPITASDLDRDFTPTESEKLFATSTTRKPAHRLGLLILLKCFQFLRRLPKIEEIAESVVNHVRVHLGLPSTINLDYEHRTMLARHGQAVLDHFGVKRFYGREARRIAVRLAYDAALAMSQPRDIMNAVIAGLIQADFELPTLSGLAKLERRVRTVVHGRMFRRVYTALTQAQKTALDQLLTTGLNQRQTAFQTIKRRPWRASRKHLEETIAHLRWLESLGDPRPALKEVAPALMRHFGQQARSLDAAELKDYGAEKRYTLLLSLIQCMQARARDTIGEMLVKRMAAVHKRAKDALTELQLQQQSRVESLLTRLEDVLDILVRETDDARTGKLVRALFKNQLKDVQAECSSVKTRTGNNYTPLLWDHYRSQRAVLFDALRVLKIDSTTEDRSVVRLLKKIQENEERRVDWVSAEEEKPPFLTPRWLKLIVHPDEPAKWNRRQLEVCVMSQVAEQLKAGNLCIIGSDSFADYRPELLSWKECQKRLPAYCQRIGIPDTADECVAELKRQLTEKAAAVDQAYSTNGELTIGPDGAPVLHKTAGRPVPESAVKLQAEFTKRIPKRTLPEILVNIEHLTNFTRHFGPGSGAKAKIRRATERYLLTLFTIGSNLGPIQAANHLQGIVTAHELSFTNQRHVTVEKLEAARRELVEFYLTLDLPKAWGSGKTVAADGTQFDFYDNNLTAGYHFRYRKLGAVAYRHVADNYIAMFSHFIPPGVWEAVYVIEGLLKPQFSVRADTVCSDTQGQSATVFAFTYLLGIHLLPRIRNWKDLKFYRPTKRTRYRHIDKLFAATVDWELIRKHWKDLMQLALSIEAGKISSPILLRKLGNQSEENRLYQAANELGSVVRTLFLLDWISNRPMRQAVTATTNKVECYHGFAKWLSFGGDVIAENDPDEQQKCIRYNDVLASAVILQNVIDMTVIIEQLEREGWKISAADLAALSPYLTPGVKRFGEYSLNLDRPLEPCIQEALARWKAPRSQTAHWAKEA